VPAPVDVRGYCTQALFVAIPTGGLFPRQSFVPSLFIGAGGARGQPPPLPPLPSSSSGTMSSTLVSAVRTFSSSSRAARREREREPSASPPRTHGVIVTRALHTFKSTITMRRSSHDEPTTSGAPPPPPKDVPERGREIRPMRSAHDSVLDIARIAANAGWPISGPPSPTSPPAASPIAKSSSAFTRGSSTVAAAPLRASNSLPSRSRAKSLPRISPEERAQRRAEEKARTAVEQRAALQAEQARQARLTAERAAQERAAELEEHHRRMRLEDELRAAAFQKDMRAREDEEAAARARDELRARRERQKARLAEEGAWLEQCRLEEAAREAELQRRREAERAALEEARRARVRNAGDHVGWVSIQQEGSMHWKRRWCQLRGRRMSLFNAPPGELVSSSLLSSSITSDRLVQDLGKPLDILTLDKTSRVRDGPSAPDELEFVKNSFALDVVGGRGTLLVYTDTADDKERLLACIRARTDL
jgi:hypothetical protein